jgi:hypothetical protein
MVSREAIFYVADDESNVAANVSKALDVAQK